MTRISTRRSIPDHMTQLASCKPSEVGCIPGLSHHVLLYTYGEELRSTPCYTPTCTFSLKDTLVFWFIPLQSLFLILNHPTQIRACETGACIAHLTFHKIKFCQIIFPFKSLVFFQFSHWLIRALLTFILKETKDSLEYKRYYIFFQNVQMRCKLHTFTSLLSPHIFMIILRYHFHLHEVTICTCFISLRFN